MRLSEAIIIGDTLGKRDKYDWLEKEPDGSYRGCAMGRAALAAGDDIRGLAIGEHFPRVRALWPWITTDQALAISNNFVRVCNGDKEFAELISYVRSIEPAEDTTGIIDPSKEEVEQCVHSLELHF